MPADIFISILDILLLGGALWYLLAFVHYIRSDQYTVDKRFWEVTR